MTGTTPLVVSRGLAAAVVLSVLGVGVAGTWLVGRQWIDPPLAHSDAEHPGATGTIAPATPPTADDGPLPDVVVPMSQDAAKRAGIVVADVASRLITDELRLPGAVAPNAYRQVLVTPLVGGRVVRVSAQLGDRVKRGQSIAQVYSPELADARTRYVAARAMLDAHDRELQRTQKLLEIGAASRQELERVHAEHAAQTAEVEGARARLQLLGVSADAVAATDSQDASATSDVPAPIDGVVTERVANVGLNVEPATKLFTIVDLSSVWVIADAYERDLHLVRDGARARVVPQAYPDQALDGRVSYVDPRLNEGTRTAQVRVEVPNPRGDLRLGMYADVVIAGAHGVQVPAIPRSAVQNVGSHQVVYLPTPGDPASFTEREVQIGRSAGDLLEVVSGVRAGDSVVSQGSFFVRAEAERLGLRSGRGRAAPAPPSAGGGSTQPRDVQSAKIVVGEKGYEPAAINLRAGAPARITFVRTTDKTCGTEVVFPSLNIKRALPLNEPVTIEFTPATSGEIAFACGMNMLRGTVVVR
jgi:RND family efflux transporter MFP subunit